MYVLGNAESIGCHYNGYCVRNKSITEDKCTMYKMQSLENGRKYAVDSYLRINWSRSMK